MGSVISYLLGGGSTRGAQDDRNLLELLNSEDMPIPWSTIQRRLASHPEEAACYGHFVDYTLLQRAFLKAQPPYRVVEAFVEAYPETIFHTPANGDTTLSTAIRCFGSTDTPADWRDQPKIVSFLLQVNPEAASQSTESHQQLPLHFIRQSPLVTRVLVRAHPSSVLARDVQNRLPLHHACACQRISPDRPEQANHDNGNEHQDGRDDQEPTRVPAFLGPSDPAVIHLLIEAAQQQGDTHGGVLSKDSKGKTPLDLLCVELCRVLGDDDEDDANNEEGTGISNQADEKDEETNCGQLWDSLTLLIQAAVSSTAPSSPFQMVHALIQSGCPTRIVSHALTLYPHQVQERDGQGRTPLMMATTFMPRKSPSTVCLLLQVHPQAARMTDGDGRLPIDILSERTDSYNEELLNLMVKAEPRAVDSRDLRDKMFPFLTAAVHSNDVNTIYGLLRAKPNVLTYFSWDE